MEAEEWGCLSIRLFCAPSWALKFPELTALSRGCFQHWGKEEFISPLPHRTSLIKHMACCTIGGGGRGEPSAVSVLNKTVDPRLAPKSLDLALPWSIACLVPAVEPLGGKGDF